MKIKTQISWTDLQQQKGRVQSLKLKRKLIQLNLIQCQSLWKYCSQALQEIWLLVLLTRIQLEAKVKRKRRKATKSLKHNLNILKNKCKFFSNFNSNSSNKNSKNNLWCFNNNSNNNNSNSLFISNNNNNNNKLILHKCLYWMKNFLANSQKNNYKLY